MMWFSMGFLTIPSPYLWKSCIAVYSIKPFQYLSIVCQKKKRQLNGQHTLLITWLTEVTGYLWIAAYIPTWLSIYKNHTLCRYVSEFLGKSKLITTLTAWMSIPLVNRSGKKRSTVTNAFKRLPIWMTKRNCFLIKPTQW